MECDFGYAMTCLPQSWNWLEDRWSEDNKISRRMWEVVETKAEKIRLAETEEEREEGGRGKETRRKRAEKRRKEEEKT